MVTANRSKLARRAIECLARQTWPSVELVIVDDGEEDYAPMLEQFAGRVEIQHHRIEKKDDVFLGGLRNISLDKATGDFLYAVGRRRVLPSGPSGEADEISAGQQA